LRVIYDKYGEDLLKNGVPEEKGGFKGGYKFSGNTYEIFEKFFGTSNPHTVSLDEEGKELHSVDNYR